LARSGGHFVAKRGQEQRVRRLCTRSASHSLSPSAQEQVRARKPPDEAVLCTWCRQLSGRLRLLAATRSCAHIYSPPAPSSTRRDPPAAYPRRPSTPARQRQTYPEQPPPSTSRRELPPRGTRVARVEQSTTLANATLSIASLLDELPYISSAIQTGRPSSATTLATTLLLPPGLLLLV
jgi:hypothetical protein